MSRWIDEVYEDNRRLGLSGTILHETLSPYQRIQIVETKALGRGLLLDGMWMTAEGDEKIYHEMLVHPALTTAPSINRVLVIGGGDGGTVREVLRYKGVKKVVLAEIDGEVVNASQKFLPSIGSAWSDPRLEIQICDGAELVMKTPPQSWDVILVDGSDPVGPAEVLYKDSFFKACFQALSADGVLSVQGGSPTVQRDEHLGILRTLRNHFSSVNPLYAPVGIYPGGAWSFVWAAKSPLDPSELRRERIEEIEEGCYWYNAELHRGALAIPNHIRCALKGDIE